MVLNNNETNRKMGKEIENLYLELNNIMDRQVDERINRRTEKIIKQTGRQTQKGNMQHVNFVFLNWKNETPCVDIWYLETGN